MSHLLELQASFPVSQASGEVRCTSSDERLPRHSHFDGDFGLTSLDLLIERLDGFNKHVALVHHRREALVAAELLIQVCLFLAQPSEARLHFGKSVQKNLAFVEQDVHLGSEFACDCVGLSAPCLLLAIVVEQLGKRRPRTREHWNSEDLFDRLADLSSHVALVAQEILVLLQELSVEQEEPSDLLRHDSLDLSGGLPRAEHLPITLKEMLDVVVAVLLRHDSGARPARSRESVLASVVLKLQDHLKSVPARGGLLPVADRMERALAAGSTEHLAEERETNRVEQHGLAPHVLAVDHGHAWRLGQVDRLAALEWSEVFEFDSINPEHRPRPFCSRSLAELVDGSSCCRVPPHGRRRSREEGILVCLGVGSRELTGGSPAATRTAHSSSSISNPSSTRACHSRP